MMSSFLKKSVSLLCVFGCVAMISATSFAPRASAMDIRCAVSDVPELHMLQQQLMSANATQKYMLDKMDKAYIYLRIAYANASTAIANYNANPTPMNAQLMDQAIAAFNAATAELDVWITAVNTQTDVIKDLKRKINVVAQNLYGITCYQL